MGQGQHGTQRAKIVKAINNLGADVVSLEEIENSAKAASSVPASFKGERRDYALSTLVDALNEQAGEGTWAYVPSPQTVPDLDVEDVIRTAFIYKPAKVATVGETRILTDSDAFNARTATSTAASPTPRRSRPRAPPTPTRSSSSPTTSSPRARRATRSTRIPATAPATRLHPSGASDALLAFTDEVKSDLKLEKVFLVGDFTPTTPKNRSRRSWRPDTPT